MVWTHFYSHDEPVSAKEVSAVVDALDKNVQRAAAEFKTSLDEYFAAHPRRPRPLQNNLSGKIQSEIRASRNP